jgi:alginate O-acetyltransferase complex protein AlgI
MAIGLGRMIGFEFPENFDHPYQSKSITEFWRRWHMSLSSWLRDYLYIPLGGSRKGTGRTYTNLMVVMVLGGLWHGASWSFVIWGAFHGLLLVYERILTDGRSRLPSALAVVRTTILTILGWVVFRASDVAASLNMYRGMFGINGFSLSGDLQWQLSGISLTALALGVAVLFWPRARSQSNLPLWRSVGVSAVFIISVMKLLADSYSPFLYFQF